MSEEVDCSLEAAAGDRLQVVRFTARDAGLVENSEAKNGKPGANSHDCVALIGTLDAIGERRLVAQIGKASPKLPVVVLAPTPSLAAATPLMRSGAYSVVDANDPSAAVAALIEAGREGHSSRAQRQHLTDLRHRFAELTKAERQVLDAMLDGMANKQIAQALEIGLRTVELRRSKIMRKMHARSLAELIKFICAVLPDLIVDTPVVPSDRPLDAVG